jgi:flagellar motor switch protein FliG
MPDLDLSNPQGVYKAAIFLLTMGDEFTTKVFQHLSEHEIKVVSSTMAKIKHIPGEAVENIMNEVEEKMAIVQAGLNIPVEEFLKKVIFQSMPNDKAEKLYEEIMKQLYPSTFQKLSSLEPKVIVNFLKNEHPQTIAVILSHLDPVFAADILGALPENLQSNVMLRIAQLDKISPDIVAEIDKVLEDELFSVEMSDAKKVGGAEKVAEILNNVDKNLEESVLEKIESASSNLAEEIRKLMFKFEDLIGLDNTAIIQILKEISTDDLKMSLKAVSDELKFKFFSNMSERASQMLKEDLEIMGPVRLKDVENAQQSIIKTAKRLEQEGKIILASKGGGEEFV